MSGGCGCRSHGFDAAARDPASSAARRLVALLSPARPEPSLWSARRASAASSSSCGRRVTAASPWYPSLARFSPARSCPSASCTTSGARPARASATRRRLPLPTPTGSTRRVVGPDVFVIPYGPIRSGVFESIQYMIETGGEDVLAPRRCGRSSSTAARGALRGAGARGWRRRGRARRRDRVRRPRDRLRPGRRARARASSRRRRAQRWRVVHAELERIANHLDVDRAAGRRRRALASERRASGSSRSRSCGCARGSAAAASGAASSCRGACAPAPLIEPASCCAELGRFERRPARATGGCCSRRRRSPTA